VVAYASAAISGALEVNAAMELVLERGKVMSAATAGGMAAVLGLEPNDVRDVCRQAAKQTGEVVVVANDNAPGQVVLAGPIVRLRAACGQARERGARAIVLDVAGAFHSPAMAGAVEPFRAELDRVELREPAIPVISGSTARPFADVRAELAAAIVRPVRWRATMLALARLGAEAFVDVGPGEVLARLVRRNLPDARVLDPRLLSAPIAVGSSGDA